MIFKRLFAFVVILVSIIVAVYFIKLIIDSGALPKIEINEQSGESNNVSAPEVGNIKDLPSIPVTVGSTTIDAFVADDEHERAKGLGERDLLALDQGMLFIFPVSSRYGFYMKGMKFPIDIVWVDESKKVIGIHKNISPDTYNEFTPELFYPPNDVKYVLELNSGASDEFKIATGTALSF